MQITYIKYVCSGCGAEDTDKLFPHEAPAPAINCFKCHAGQGKDIAMMLQSSTGMFPVLKQKK